MEVSRMKLLQAYILRSRLCMRKRYNSIGPRYAAEIGMQQLDAVVKGRMMPFSVIIVSAIEMIVDRGLHIGLRCKN